MRNFSWGFYRNGDAEGCAGAAGAAVPVFTGAGFGGAEFVGAAGAAFVGADFGAFGCARAAMILVVAALLVAQLRS